MIPNPILTFLESLAAVKDVIGVLIYPAIVPEGAELSFVVCLADGSRMPPHSLGTTDLDQVLSWRQEAVNWISSARRNGHASHWPPQE